MVETAQALEIVAYNALRTLNINPTLPQAGCDLSEKQPPRHIIRHADVMPASRVAQDVNMIHPKKGLPGRDLNPRSRGRGIMTCSVA